MSASSSVRRAPSAPTAHPDETARSSRLLAALPIASCALFAAFFLVAPGPYRAVVTEDGPVEWLTAVAYLPAIVLAGMVAHRRARLGDKLGAAAYAVLTLGFFFLAGEEVSWFQRQLGFGGPEVLVEHNVQHEANLHNLLGAYGLHMGFILVGLWGAFGRTLVHRIRAFHPAWLYAPRAIRWTWFLPVAAYHLWRDYLGRIVALVVGPWFQRFAEGPPRYEEPMEMLLAVGFALFVWDAVRLTRRNAARDRVEHAHAVPPLGADHSGR